MAVCVLKIATPPSWRFATECAENEYVAAAPPGDDWVWDVGLGAHRPRTEGERVAATNSATWAAQAAARKDREAKAALALPDSEDPIILRRKLNAALHLIQR